MTIVDPSFAQVVLALNCNGSDGSTVFTDLKGKSVTGVGNARISTAQSKFGGSSLFLDGTGDKLTVPASIDWYLGATYTIELWMYPTALPGSGNSCRVVLIGNNDVNTSLTLEISTSGGLVLAIPKSATVPFVTHSGIVRLNEWHLYTFSVQAGYARLFVDGGLVSSGLVTTQVSTSGNGLVIGFDTPGTVNFNYLGFIDDLRITKGVARYFDSFATGSDPYWSNVVLLLSMEGPANSTVFGDALGHLVTTNGNAKLSTTQIKYGISSAYFDGTGDFLTLADSADLEWGGSDLCLEMWAYTGATNSYAALITRKSSTGFTAGAWGLFINIGSATGRVALYVGDYLAGGSPLLLSASGNINNSAWHHIAITRSGSNWTLWFDGICVGNNTWAGTITDIGFGPCIAEDQNFAGRTYTGYIDDLRFTKGVSRYSPTSFLVGSDSSWASVVMYLPLDGLNNSVEIGEIKGHTPTVNGNAKISTAQSKFGGSSLLLDGTGDYLSFATSADWDFAAGDFTIECWVYISANSIPDAGGYRSASIASVWTSSSVRGWSFALVGDSTTTGTGITFDTWDTAGNATIYRATVSISQGVWHHLALTVASGTRNLFLDGSLLSAVPSSAGTGYTQANSFSNPMTIGATLNTSYPLCLNGYIDDLRITKGVARYTATFTPPASACPVPNFAAPTSANSFPNFVVPTEQFSSIGAEVVPVSIASGEVVSVPALQYLLQVLFPVAISSEESVGVPWIFEKDENNLMNLLYDLARERFSKAELAWSAGVVRVILLDTTLYTYNPAHQFLDSVPALARVATSSPLTGRTSVGGACNADNISFLSVSGPPINAICVYLDTGVEATSLLVAYLDGVGFPIVPDGGLITLVWDTGPNKMFRL